MVEPASKVPIPAPEDVVRAMADPANDLGKYVKIERLGVGGMGEVWSAWDRELHRRVALKFLKRDDLEEIERFKREALTVAHLSHPNIAFIYEVGQAGGKPFIAMQLIKGTTLGAFPRKDRKLLVRLVRDACLAIQYAHERRVIHRDLKPANFMVEQERPSSSARIIVLDFGLARQTSVDSSLSVSGMALGTPAYMAPEQARGEIHSVSEASDVYSLGATLYELLTGGPPFREKDLYALLRSVVEKEPLPLRRRNASVDDELETIVMKCLEKDPARRYPSALALAEDLSRWLGGEPIQARHPTVTYRIRKGVSRHKIAAAAGGLLVLALAVAGLFWMGSRMERDREREEHLEQAALFSKKEEYQKALEHYSRALELGSSEDPEVRSRIKDCQARLEQVARRVRAEAAAHRAFEDGKAKLDEAGLDFYRQGADLVRTRERLEKAISELTRSIEVWDGSPDAFIARGRAHAFRFEFDQAEADFSKAIALDPGSAVARKERGKLLLERTIEAKLNMGWVWDASVAQPFEQWKRKARQDLVDEAYVAFAEERLADCLSACAKSLKEKPDQEELRKLQGDALYLSAPGTFDGGKKVPAEKLFALALTSYGEALRLRPNYYEARIMRGSTSLKVGRREDARKDLEEALRLRPEDTLACTFMSETEESPREALAWLERALRTTPDSFLARMHKARALALLERYAEATETLDAATRLNPGHYYAWYLRGAFRGRTGDMEGAYADFKETTKRAPLDVSGWFNLGASARNTGRFKEAIEAWEKALTLAPPNRAEIEQLLALTRAQSNR